MPRSPFVTVVVLLLVTTAPVHAGPLDPPPGPIAPTQKPLAEIEPRTAINAANTPGDADSLFRISQPGAYFLTASIAGVAARHGIEIVSSGVTIDLNGFEVIGVPGALHGIFANGAALSNIEVRNGAVRNWPGVGVHLGSSGPANSVRDVRASSNANGGIGVAGASFVINCIVLSNGANGISTGNATLVSQCAAHLNTIDGIDVANSCVVDSCTALLNGGTGIEASAAATITRSTAQDNAIFGFSVSNGCTISECAAFSNDASGIKAFNGNTISNNSCRSNGLDGISAVSSCSIIANTCSVNGTDPATGAGIHITGFDNRIEGNTCVAQDRGIDIGASGNLIIRNGCSGNTTNWEIAANNVFGPIINRSAPASPAVSGDAAASTLGSTDANANYTY